MVLFAVAPLVHALVSSLLFSLVGIAVFVLGFTLVRKMLPFDVRKEIEVDQNVSLGIIIGACIIGLALIIAAAIHG